MPLPLLITRPVHQAERFARELETALPGAFTPILSPLFEIVPETATPDLSSVQALLFTSANAVRCFADITPDRHLPALCVGDRTAAEAEAIGLTASSAAGDVSALAELAAASYLPGAGHLLHLRGSETAGDLTGALLAEGVAAQELILYDQRPCPLSSDAKRALATQGPLVVPLFSPRTAAYFGHELREVDARADLILPVISRNVAERVDLTTSARILISTRPDLGGMIHVLESLHRDFVDSVSGATGE